MTKPRDPEALLAAYFADGMEALPDRVVESILDRAHRTRQRTVVRPRSVRAWFRPALAAVAVVAVLVAGGSLFVVSRVGPEATPSVQPSPSLPGDVAPSSTPDATATDSSGFPRSTGVWIPTGSMGTSRERVDAVRLLDGRVLVVGPATGDADDTSAEVYDPVSGTWSATESMLKPHEGFPPTLLRDGRVLVGDVEDPAGDSVYGAEVYDPETGTWSATGPIVEPAHGGGSWAVLLRDGSVLVMHPLGRSELYDPDRGTWTATGKMIWGGGTATLLRDGTVLVAGAELGNFYPTDTAELYDPDTGSWTAIASMHAKRKVSGAVLQPDGKVLVVGSYSATESAELYDPATGAWTATGDLVGPGAFYQSITQLADGTVLVTGTVDDRADPFAELYDPDTGTWTTIAPMLRSPGKLAILLLDGSVLVEAELYIPAGVSPPAAVAALPSPTPTPAPTPTPSPTPVPTPYPPEAGPVPPGARSWKIPVFNNSSQPATLFVAEEDEQGLMGPLVGSATPNVVAPGATVNVTFLLPATGTDWVIFVNPGPNERGLVGPVEMSLGGQIKIAILSSGQPAWMSP